MSVASVAVGVDASGAKPRGLIVIESHHCTTCHSLDGSVTVGPTFKGRFGTSAVVEVGGAERTVTLDEAYYRRAIQDPGAELVKGYPPVMPKAPMNHEDLNAVIEYLRTLK